MTDYLYQNDGKIHTRYTELKRCTPGQIERVLDERAKLISRFKNINMDWGSDRHEMWEKEARDTGKLPELFGVELGVDWPVEYIEHEFTTEILPNMVVHSRPDVVSVTEKAVIDYKTLAAESFKKGQQKARLNYSRSNQLLFYAFQLGMHGIEIRKAVFLVEIWNKEYTEILGYTKLERDLDLKVISTVLPWTRERLLCLASAIAAREAKV